MRLKFKKWLQLGEKNKKIAETIKSRKFIELANAIIDYVSFASDIDVKDFPWYDVALQHSTIQKENEITLEVPLVVNTSDTKIPPEPWDYDGRSWYSWANMFADAYGWTIDYIAELDVDDAVALAQEILVHEQLDKEWTWGLSEIAYPYDKSSGKSKFQPLVRPAWMRPIKKGKTQVKLPKSWLPAGIVLMGTNESTKPM